MCPVSAYADTTALSGKGLTNFLKIASGLSLEKATTEYITIPPLSESEKTLAFRNNDVNMDDYQTIQTILDNSKFHEVIKNSISDKNHVLREVVSDLSLMKSHEGDKLDSVYRMITFMKENESDWVEQNIQSTYDPNQFNEKCKEIAKNYPLLENLSDSLYNWCSMTERNLGKNIVDYVLMCDLVGEGD